MASAIYPSSLVPFIRKAWNEVRRTKGGPEPLPGDEELTRLLTTVYHASLLKEEGRRLEFRVIAYPRRTYEQDNKSLHHPSRFAVFDVPRRFSVAELRRLAPAAESIRSIICVDLDRKKRWEIWGILDTGSNWWEFIHHESSGGTPPPAHLTLSSGNPGEVTVSTEGEVLLTLRNGAVFEPQTDLFSEGVISDHLEPVRTRLYKEVLKALKIKKWSDAGSDEYYPKRFYNFCLSRVLTAIRDKGHGGTLLLVPGSLSVNDSRLTGRVAIKYPSDYDYIWGLMVKYLELHRRFVTLHPPMWNSKSPLDPERYRSISLIEDQCERVGESLSDCFRFVGALAGVDGAVVMTTHFRVLGFGGEVVAPSPTLNSLMLAFDSAASRFKDVSIEEYGTRHRSALRFCSSHEDSIAFIVSQDGGVRAAKRVGPDVYMWPDVTMGSVGL